MAIYFQTKDAQIDVRASLTADCRQGTQAGNGDQRTFADLEVGHRVFRYFPTGTLFVFIQKLRHWHIIAQAKLRPEYIFSRITETARFPIQNSGDFIIIQDQVIECVIDMNDDRWFISFRYIPFKPA